VDCFKPVVLKDGKAMAAQETNRNTGRPGTHIAFAKWAPERLERFLHLYAKAG
jgi:hypothetical protein